jgi:carbon monoxide dehydrogenase subunit G
LKLQHSFTIPVPLDQAWDALLDIGRVAQCFPGAALDAVEGDDFTGTVKLKLGPISMTYAGQASFTSKNELAHRVSLDASGRDARGAGTARALVTAVLTESPEGTTVTIDTDLAITGKPAQFGRGVISEVSDKILGQFVANLRTSLLDAAAPAPSGPAAGATPRSVSAVSSGAAREDAQAASIDLLSPAVLLPLAKRAVPVLLAVVVVLTVGVRRRR